MTHKTKRSWGQAVFALLLAAFLMPALAGTAQAYVDRDWRAHEVRARHWHVAHPVPVPGYVYAPPVVYAPPPPVSPGLNLIIPMHFN